MIIGDGDHFYMTFAIMQKMTFNILRKNLT